MGPFETHLSNKCNALKTMLKYFPEYEGAVNENLPAIMSWAHPAIIEYLEAKCAYLHEHDGISPEGFMAWLDVSVRVFTNKLKAYFAFLEEKGTLPETQAQRYTLWRTLMAHEMSKQFGIPENKYLIACGENVL